MKCNNQPFSHPYQSCIHSTPNSGKPFIRLDLSAEVLDSILVSTPVLNCSNSDTEFITDQFDRFTYFKALNSS